MWIHDHELRNFVSGDCVLDWLNHFADHEAVKANEHYWERDEGNDIHQEEANDDAAIERRYRLVPDNKDDQYDPSLEFSIFIQEKRQVFFDCLLQHLARTNDDDDRGFVANDEETTWQQARGNKIAQEARRNSWASGVVDIDCAYHGCARPSGGGGVDDGSAILFNHMTKRQQERERKGMEQTRQAMHTGIPVIARGILADSEHQLYVHPDLLVREDCVKHLVRDFRTLDPDFFEEEDEERRQHWNHVPTFEYCAINDSKHGDLRPPRERDIIDSQHSILSEGKSPCCCWRYVIVQVVYRSLKFSTKTPPSLIGGKYTRIASSLQKHQTEKDTKHSPEYLYVGAANSGDEDDEHAAEMEWYSVLAHAQNRALAAAQDGWRPNETYILGRQWQCGDLRCGNALDTLGVIDCRPCLANTTRIPTTSPLSPSSRWVWPPPSRAWTIHDLKKAPPPAGSGPNAPIVEVTHPLLHQSLESGDDGPSIHALAELGVVTNCWKVDETVNQGTAWLRQLKREGHRWTLLPKPSLECLYPNMKNSYSFPWTQAKAWIAQQLKDITLLWHCGPNHRRRAWAEGIYHWDDPKLSAELLGHNPHSRLGSTIDRMLDVHKQKGTVWPTKLANRKGRWTPAEKLEFFVDFEFVSSVNDPMTTWPRVMDRSRIVMIGCAHVDFLGDGGDLHDKAKPRKTYIAETKKGNNVTMTTTSDGDGEAGAMCYKAFVADPMYSLEREAAIIDQWMAWMDHVKNRYLALTATTNQGRSSRESREREIVVWHWSPAEVGVLERHFNCAANRHGRPDWKGRVVWRDMCALFLQEQIVIRNCLGFGLKPIIKALYKMGKVNQIWPQSQVDHGLSAMIALIRCAALAEKHKCRLMDLSLMKEADAYLRLDVLSMHSLLSYLRDYHL